MPAETRGGYEAPRVVFASKMSRTLLDAFRSGYKGWRAYPMGDILGANPENKVSCRLLVTCHRMIIAQRTVWLREFCWTFLPKEAHNFWRAENGVLISTFQWWNPTHYSWCELSIILGIMYGICAFCYFVWDYLRMRWAAQRFAAYQIRRFQRPHQQMIGYW